jgi:hypothetical protein
MLSIVSGALHLKNRFLLLSLVAILTLYTLYNEMWNNEKRERCPRGAGIVKQGMVVLVVVDRGWLLRKQRDILFAAEPAYIKDLFQPFYYRLLNTCFKN